MDDEENTNDETEDEASSVTEQGKSKEPTKRENAKFEVDVSTITSAVISIVNSIKSRPLAQKGRHYPNAFDVSEKIIKSFNTRAEEILNDPKVDWFPESPLEFRASIGMPDLTRRDFSDFEKFITRGGDNSKLERLELEWIRRLKFPFASEVSIKVSFFTERKLEMGELSLFNYQVAGMSLLVAGFADKYVEDVFAQFDPLMEASKISILYSPLLILRNEFVVNIISNAAALCAMLISQVKVFDYLRVSELLNRDKIVETIAKNQDISEKINIFAKELLSPEKSPLWYIAVSLFTGAVIYAATMATLMKTLPFLIPRSLINVGLSKNFNDKYRNIYRLIVVTIIFGSIIIPAGKKIIELLMQ